MNFVHGIDDRFSVDSPLFCVQMGSAFGVWLKKMAFIFRSFLLSVSALFIALVGYVGRIFFRYHEVEDSTEENMNSFSDSSVILKEDDRADTISTERLPHEWYIENSETSDSKLNDFDERKTSDFVFRFHFPTYEEFSKSRKEISDFSVSPMSNNHEFLPEKSARLLVEESFEAETDNDTLKTARFLSEKDLTEDKEEISVAEDVPFHNDQSEKLLNNSLAEKCLSEMEFIGSDSYSCLISSSNENNLTEEKEEIIAAEDFCSDIDRRGKIMNSSVSAKCQSEMEFTGSDSYPDSINSSNDFSATSELITTSSDGLLSDMDSEEDLHLNNMNFGYNPDDSEEEEELQFLKDSNTRNPDIENSEKNSYTSSANPVISSNVGKTETEDSSAMDSEDQNSLETLWEHQDLLEQLKMEMKKVKAIGLPTIFEESESPKIMEDLKPWKIDEKFEHGNLVDELHKFYKSYRERMRKLDILNYQKMYTIGFLQPKDSVKSFSSISKSTSPSISSLLSNYRTKKQGIDPMKKFIRELYTDLEMIYVGQMCLSWEFIQWQYDKALDLWESEPYGIHLYNNVAGEFQQFQVVLQRFVENEPFEGPRIESYVKTRCLTRNLLQVPLIREDTTRGIKKKGKDDSAITTADLIEILQESIRVVWRFIQADKQTNDAKSNTILKSRKGSRTELQNPADSRLLADVHSELHRKKRKVKEMARSGNCVLKRFQKGEGRERESSEQHLYFFCQVDMKVVSRVLKMSRLTTDQLVWCQNKLSRISFSSRRQIRVEPSFFLFPCS